MKMELRIQDSEMKSNSDGTLTVSGYVNKTDEPSNILGSAKRFVEKISKGVFTRAIENSKRDIDFLAEHDSSKILASTRNNSLVLNEDEKGLYMEATIAPTSWGKDAYTLIESGIYRNMSFGFKVVKDNWRSLEKGLYERTIEDMELFEVSVVKNPAYSQSTIAARGIDVLEDVEIPAELQEEERAMDELKSLMESINEKLTTVLDKISSPETKSDKSDKEDEEERKQLPPKTEEEKEDEDKEKSKSEDEDKKSKTDEDEGEDKEDKEPRDEDNEDKKKDKDEDDEEDEEEKENQKRSNDSDLSDFKTRLKTLRQED